MFHWDSKYKWVFSDLGGSDKVGVNDAGIGIFKRQPYKGLAKEICQNVTDAKNKDLPKDTPVKVRFELIYIDRDDIPDNERLNQVIHQCYEYYHDGDDGQKMKVIQDAAEKYLNAPGKVPVLKISDYNTTGLKGVRAEKGTNWTGLVRERGATNKTNGANGAFGVGKFAPYNFSSIRTVLYSTKTVDDEVAFQGKALLTTFKEEGKNKQNIGLFADSDTANYDAIFDINSIAPVFRREENGTDIFVLGFEKEDEWVDQTAISVLEYFFYSIYKGDLEVEVVDGDTKVSITKKNLGKMIDKYEEYCNTVLKDDTTFEFTAPLYWKMLTDSRSKKIELPFTYNNHAMGNYELYLLVEDDVAEKKVLEMRQGGMKIREDIFTRVPINFTGVFIATGEGACSEEPKDNISSFLRKCENQAHDAWSADEYKEEKVKAKGIINKIHSLILEAVKNEMPEYDSDSVDAFGLSEFLPNEESDDDPKEEKAFADFRPLTFEVQNVKPGKSKKQVDISMRTNGGSKKTGQKKKKQDNPKKRKTNNQRGRKDRKPEEIELIGIKTPFDSNTHEYAISFTSEEDAETVYLGIRIASDDDNMAKAVIATATEDKSNLKVKNGMIELAGIKCGEKRIIHVRLTDEARKSLEVRAYVES